MVGVFFGGLVLPEQGNGDFAAAVTDKAVVYVCAALFACGFFDFHAGVIRDGGHGIANQLLQCIQQAVGVGIGVAARLLGDNPRRTEFFGKLCPELQAAAFEYGRPIYGGQITHAVGVGVIGIVSRAQEFVRQHRLGIHAAIAGKAQFACRIELKPLRRLGNHFRQPQAAALPYQLQRLVAV